jgi:hypothetical protein
MIVLNAKPKQNDVAIDKITNVFFFMLPEFLLHRVGVSFIASELVFAKARNSLIDDPEQIPD